MQSNDWSTEFLRPDDQMPAGGETSFTTSMSRRTVLGAAGALGLAGLTAACSGMSSTNDSSGGSAGTGTVRVWTVQSGPETEAFERAQLEAFGRRNPDIGVELQVLPPEQFANAMQLAFTGGEDIPDVFRHSAGQGVHLRSALERGWVRPVTEFITDEFASRFPHWVYDGASALYVDGEAYGVPRADTFANGSRMLYYNVDILERFGFSGPPETWSEFREIAAKISTDGNNAVYGTALVGANIASFQILQNLAGPQHYRDDAETPISLLTGEPAMSEPSLVETVELLQAMNRQGSFTPGWETWAPSDAIQQMASGRLGMYIFPIFHAAQLRQANPDLNLGIARPPVPDAGRSGSRAPADTVLPWWMMSAEVRDPEAAWRLMDFYGSVEYQRAGFLEEQRISIMPGVYDGIDVDQDTLAIREIAQDLVRQRPSPSRRSPEADTFYDTLVADAPRPAPAELYVNAIVTESDFAATAAEYDEAVTQLIDEKIAAGAIDSMEAFTFPDWDPLEDYEG
ncbi:ABC transporter substrate-binding protein [Ruania alba]|uniref:Multiple sugar transport system substrate-binding protein n=1 Tax=Ruania alba TaxID=648782 RepID=A0A1H5HNA6_9MICO|nr:extracellular solute-binding protein [Ruania alba]SEE28738.1 multiple sugar transport system substrate-binding protein [Ruania alba]